MCKKIVNFHHFLLWYFLSIFLSTESEKENKTNTSHHQLARKKSRNLSCMIFDMLLLKIALLHHMQIIILGCHQFCNDTRWTRKIFRRNCWGSYGNGSYCILFYSKQDIVLHHSNLISFELHSWIELNWFLSSIYIGGRFMEKFYF